jgi:hypothetical protein
MFSTTVTASYDFDLFSAKLAIFSKNDVFLQFYAKIAVFWVKIAYFNPNFSGENILKRFKTYAEELKIRYDRTNIS